MALDGTHPTLRLQQQGWNGIKNVSQNKKNIAEQNGKYFAEYSYQSPPNMWASIMATRAPTPAEPAAVIKPPVPPPITTIS